MTQAFICINDATYGGLYYCASFTGSGTQPVWVKLTTTGLDSTSIAFFGIDPSDPINRHYAMTDARYIYYRNNGDWTEIMSDADARTLCGVSDTGFILRSFYADPTIAGRITTMLTYDTATASATCYIIQSDDYGANWAVAGSFTMGNNGGNYVQAIGDYIWVSGHLNVSSNLYIWASDDGGSTWYSESLGESTSLNWPAICINRANPAICYTQGGSGSALPDLIMLEHTGSDISPTTIISSVFASVSTLQADSIYSDPDVAGREVFLHREADLYYTDDNWASYSSAAISGVENDCRGIIGAYNEGSLALAFDVYFSEGGIYYLDDETDTTAAERSGANSESAPYTDSVPDKPAAFYGVWFGSLTLNYQVYII